MAFKLINDFLSATFKGKPDGNLDQGLIYILSNKMKLGLSKSQISSPDFFKTKENINFVKEKMLKFLYTTLNNENDLKQEGYHSQGYSKYFVGNGNNPLMVKSILKQRWWWTAVDSMDTANLVWTQWKKPRLINSLPCVRTSDTKLSDISSKPLSRHKTTTGKQLLDLSSSFLRMCNHVEGNAQLGNKKGLFYNMKAYYEAQGKNPFSFLPITFHIQQGSEDPEFEKFVAKFNKERGEKVWIVKPGENTNRGRGITICKTLEEITEIVNERGKHTYIIQKYIEKPLLIHKRKFDIRCYGLVTSFGGITKGYFYRDGYLRTASREFTLKSLSSKIVHLTNEAVQVKYEDFGRFEPGNKMTYSDLQKYLEQAHSSLRVDFYSHILPQIKRLVTDSVRAVHEKLDPNGRQHTFELFGYDFMLDSNFHIYLIEANINPCLEIKSPITARIVPAMLDSAIRIAIDPLFQPPHDLSVSKKTTSTDILPEIKHELIYDSRWDAPELDELATKRREVILELEDEEDREEEREELLEENPESLSQFQCVVIISLVNSCYRGWKQEFFGNYIDIIIVLSIVLKEYNPSPSKMFLEILLDGTRINQMFSITNNRLIYLIYD